MGISLSIAAPAYNEAQGLAQVLLHWHRYLKTNSAISNFEIIICNDGSTDNTKNILDELAETYSEIKPLHLPINHGAAYALNQAIAKTQCDWVLLTDSDDQFPIENFSKLYQAIEIEQAQAVIGIRHKQDGLIATWGSKWSGAVCNFIHRSKLKDFNSAFKLIQGDILRALHLEARGMNYSTEITSRLLEKKIYLVEIPIMHQKRQVGKSNLKLLRDSMHRFLFVLYLSLRQLLLRVGVL